MKITTIRINTPEGQQRRAALRNRFSEESDSGCRERVTDILARVRQEGDGAVLDYCRQFDSPAMTLESLRVSPEEFAQAQCEVDEKFCETLRFAADRIRGFHEREIEDSWMLTRDDGTITGRMVRPVDSAGLYVPGGKEGSTPLVSSVLMNGIPAQIAGVARRVMVTPAQSGGSRQPGSFGRSQRNRHRRGLQGRFSLGCCRAGLRNGNHPQGGRDRRAGQPVCGRGQTSGDGPGAHRHDRRAQRGADHRR